MCLPYLSLSYYGLHYFDFTRFNIGKIYIFFENLEIDRLNSNMFYIYFSKILY